ncbi:MAG: rhodanese-like domain-containing protein [Bacteroidetes bacterium]|nr:rhodanese-like domain-containing protein [Bacteroidota bacterium]
MKSLITFSLFFVSISVFSQIRLLEVDEFKQVVGNKNVQIIDVRTPYEYNSGHIQGAVNIDYYASDFEKQLAKLDKNIPIYFYCHSGVRSAKAAKTMKALGFTKIYDLKGGMVAWKKAGLKVSR